MGHQSPCTVELHVRLLGTSASCPYYIPPNRKQTSILCMNFSLCVCSAGIGRTGAFCALSIAIERVKEEGLIDVFHTVKHLRTQRPHMVQTPVSNRLHSLISYFPLSRPITHFLNNVPFPPLSSHFLSRLSRCDF